MKYVTIATALFGIIVLNRPALGEDAATTRPSVDLTHRPQSDERLSFQTGGPWKHRVNLNADVAMCYGITSTLPERIGTWRDHGYTVHVMTGVAWGEYQDYLFGVYDGIKHEDAEGQRAKNGVIRAHGPGVPYISPGDDYGKYLCIGVRKALDAGAEAIHLEEPEFWADTGWEPNFKTQWRDYYGEDWIAPDSSPDAQYRASKLKYYLYRRALKTVFDFVHQYNQEHGRDVKCYVATHSLLNYASWGIVSPESSLMDVGCDGYIAQIWTATGRTPNFYEGRKKERTFETAFLEYGAMQNLVRGNGKRMWYLNDPIEDNLRHPWSEYRTHWESTLVASLLQPEVHRFEVMPWPQRIFEDSYPTTNPSWQNPTPVKVSITPDYETELQAVMTGMGDLAQPADQTGWEIAGTRGIGVLVSDTLMFQRYGASPSDEQLGNFYGLSMPLLKRGMPVEPVQVETASLDPYKVLLLTYEGQKPPTPAFHDRLNAWVRKGGVLVVVDDDQDPYNAVREWWNTGNNHFAKPRHALFDTLGIQPDTRGPTAVGDGFVIYESASPTKLSRDPAGGNRIRSLAHEAADAVKLEWKETNALVLRRGPYVIAAGLDESVPDAAPQRLTGRFVNLYDARQDVVDAIDLNAGKRAFAIDLNRFPKDSVGVIAAAGRVRDERITDATISFNVDGIENSAAVISVLTPTLPKRVTLDGMDLPGSAWDFNNGICRVRFTNTATPRALAIER